jgi:NADH dehydrogenase (ubiquinone) Fe-S protein 2
MQNINNYNIKKRNQLLNYTLNFGPQHPAAHGVLRLIIELEGETIINVDPHIGLLHRGTEKLIEQRNYLESLPYFDRLDYVSMMAQEHCYSLAVEKLLDIEHQIPYKARCIRCIFLELTRILNHLLAITTHALDIGAITPFLWAFEEREKIMELYEMVSGARMHAAYIRPGGVSFDISTEILDKINKICLNLYYRLHEIEEVLSYNRIWEKRLINIGIISLEEIFNYGLTGVFLRAAGFSWDLRKVFSYEIYDNLTFNIPVKEESDCYARYLIRMSEMFNSLGLIHELYSYLISLNNINSDINLFSLDKNEAKSEMLSLIKHFKYYTEGLSTNKYNKVYVATEAPKGEFGVFLEAYNTFDIKTNIPYRCHIKAPGFLTLQSLGLMSKNHMLSDLVTIIGTQDIVFGEIDR